MRLAWGRISRIRATCSPTGAMSDRPVMLAPGLSIDFTSWADTGSVTAVNTTGMSRVAAATAWADGVEIGTITSGREPANWRAIWAAVAGLPCAL